MSSGTDPGDLGAPRPPAAPQAPEGRAPEGATNIAGADHGATHEAVAEGDSDQAEIDALIAGVGLRDEEQAFSAGVDSEPGQSDELGAAMAAALAEEKASGAAEDAAGAALSGIPIKNLELPRFDAEDIASETTQPISLLHDVQLHVKIELGRTNMFVEDVLRLGEGSVVELDRLAGDPVDVYVNGRLVARGEVLVLNDNFCVRVSEIISDPNARMDA